jgi:uncharacterized cupin superfamily protein
MTEAPKHLVRTRDLSADDAVHVRHPFNPNSEVYVHRLGDMVGMKRAHLSLARVPPGRESFVAHAHSLQEEFLYILEGSGIAEIGAHRVPVGPGDYLGFPIDGTPHHLHNVGDSDLVYLMGGERTEVEVAYFPTLGKIAVAHGPDTSFFDQDAAEHREFREWIVDDEAAQR